MVRLGVKERDFHAFRTEKQYRKMALGFRAGTPILYCQDEGGPSYE